MNRGFLIIGAVAVSLLLAIFLIGRAIIGTGAAKAPAMGAAHLNINIGEEAALSDKARSMEAQGDLLKAKEAYQAVIEKFPNSGNIAKTQSALENINIKILFSPVPTEDSFLYEVAKGDSLAKIARKFNTTVELISKSNGLKDAAIRTGKRLKITKAKFSVIVDKSQNILTLKSNGEILKTYAVSTGKNSSTPTGNFTVTNKVVNPPWYPPSGGVIPASDSKNVLGSRWIGISKPGYGIHGTTSPETIGKSVTEGCVRLKNSDVEELYSIIPGGTEVIIVD